MFAGGGVARFDRGQQGRDDFVAADEPTGIDRLCELRAALDANALLELARTYREIRDHFVRWAAIRNVCR